MAAKVKLILFHQITWQKLSKIGQNRIFKSSYFWLVFVPIIAKLFSGTSSLLTFTILGQSMKVNFALPFSWKIFFLTAVTFSIGNLIYSLWCPGLVAEFKDYAEFESRGHSGSRIITDTAALLFKWKPAFAFQSAIKPLSAHILCHFHFVDEKGQPFPASANGLDTMITELTTRLYSVTDTKEAFWRLHRLYDHSYISARVAVAVFYFMGLLATGYLVFENIRFVVRFILNEQHTPDATGQLNNFVLMSITNSAPFTYLSALLH